MGDALPDDDAGALEDGGVEFAAHVGHVLTGGEPLALEGGLHRVGAGGDDVHVFDGGLRRVHGADVQFEFGGHLLRVALAVGLRRAEHLDGANVADGGERLEVRPGHSA